MDINEIKQVPIVDFLYILRHRRNDVDSIIIEELAHYCFSSHFLTHLIALIYSADFVP